MKSKVFWRFLCSLLYSCYPLPPLWLIICVFFPTPSVLLSDILSFFNTRQHAQCVCACVCHTMPSCICVLVGLSSCCSCFWKSWAMALWTNSYCSWREKDKDMMMQRMERRKVLQKAKDRKLMRWRRRRRQKVSANQYRHKNISSVCTQIHPFTRKYNLFENNENSLDWWTLM